jgi:hypothetical protein
LANGGARAGHLLKRGNDMINCQVLMSIRNYLSIFLVIFLFTSLFLNPCFAYDNKFVHPYITEQAFWSLPQDLRSAIGVSRLGNSRGDRTCIEAHSGTSITQGSIDEDVYDPLGDTCLNPLNAEYLFHHHFYDPDNDDDSTNGLAGSPGAVFYAQTYMNIAIQSFQNDPDKSYWYLGSVHPETPDETLLVSNSETRDFSSWQGNQGIARRRTQVRRTSKPED